MQTDTTDVLIVGAGPAGLATAIGLARRGVDFRIIDALPTAQNTSRAAVIHAGTLDALDGLGLAEPLVAQGIRVPDFRLRDRDTVLLHVDFSTLRAAHPYALTIPQDETEAIMTAHLARLGHTVRRPLRLTGFRQHPGRIEAACNGPDGPVQIAARFIIGADGQDSTVRDSAGIAFPGQTYGSFLLADVRMDWPIARTEVTLFFAQSGLLVVAPMSQDRYRIVAQLADAPSRPGIADVQRLLDQRGPLTGATVHQVLWGSRFRVNEKLADRFTKGAVALVGDAAHVHSPAGGQGMNLGLRDAVHLADALAQAIAGDGAALDAYDAGRRPQAARVLAMTARLTRLATMGGAPRLLRNPAIRAVGRIPAVRRYVAQQLAGMG